MSTSSAKDEISSPRIFASSVFTIDESKLCFNKSHFSRPDFNVQRFMNLARQKAELKQIQQDLRLYLKSVQNSMIELINDDYADFVHLSSNLVSLQDTLNKIEKEINAVWNDFEQTTLEAVGTAGKVENCCEELTSNRERQSYVRDRIAFLSALEKLSTLLRTAPKEPNVLWLEKVASFVVDVASARSQKMITNEREEKCHQLVLSKLEDLLCSEGVRSLSGNCATLPLVLSILTLTDSTHALTARLVSDLIYPKLVRPNDDSYQRLTDVFSSILEMRANWSNTLGHRFHGPVRVFLDQTLLTFLLTFIDKCMGTVAVPSDTRLFHRCYLATQDFIGKWPSGRHSRAMLKLIREKFNLVVYFKLETHKHTRAIEANSSLENVALCEQQNSENFYYKLSLKIFDAVESLWEEEVYLPPLVDKLWDFTLRLISKHFSWVKSAQKHFGEEGNQIEGVPRWKCLLWLRGDASRLQSEAFDFALESVWPKLRDLDVDTSSFGQCLTKHGRSVDALCSNIDSDVVQLFSGLVNKELTQVNDVPKQYRWTKKPPPSTHSAYVSTAVSMIDEFENVLRLQEHPNVQKLVLDINQNALDFFALKAKEVQDSVEATGSSLSRFKKKEASDGTTDDDKIKIQIHHDAIHLLERSRLLGITVDGLETLSQRYTAPISKDSSRASPAFDAPAASINLETVQTQLPPTNEEDST
ncbi:unnamed protein product [Caenorhabditis auriculariae]|uniref:Conserved oligomeric Golgi complex subunit 2 n=1 Tax=Caenorhabditis auriculariae TaxID=2777116 RepID=A0A8S1H7R4_9PELO|nr:unnamed protein product [Caenorhabditis auriculariae]